MVLSNKARLFIHQLILLSNLFSSCPLIKPISHGNFVLYVHELIYFIEGTSNVMRRTTGLHNAIAGYDSIDLMRVISQEVTLPDRRWQKIVLVPSAFPPSKKRILNNLTLTSSEEVIPRKGVFLPLGDWKNRRWPDYGQN